MQSIAAVRRRVTATAAFLVAACVAPSTAPAENLAWSRVDHDERVFGGPRDQWMAAVAVGGPGLVAVGSEWDSSSTSSDSVAAVWTSSDGLSWSKAPEPEAILGGPDGTGMLAVTAGGPGLVAVGWASSAGDIDAAVWTSANGLTWSRVPRHEAVFGGPDAQTMAAVTVWGSGLVAVGRDASGGDVDAAVWISSDGLTWSRVPRNKAVFGGSDAQSMAAVTAWGGGLVAVGADDSPNGGAAVWTSSDGLSWSRVPRDEGVFGGPNYQEMASVTVWERGLVAVGWDFSVGDPTAAIWISANGRVWSRAPDIATEPVEEVRQWMDSVTVFSPGLVTVGWDSSGEAGDAAVWTSSDGLSWARAPDDEGVFGGSIDQQMSAVAAGGPGLVAVGLDSSGGESDAAVWTAETP